MSAADREMIAQLQREGADYANRLDEWRARAGEAIRLLHMLDRPDARHPDVAAFLDGLDDDPAPAWLDVPDSDGWWWMRDADGRLYITHLYVSRDGLRTLHGSYPALMNRQWQRVAPPREG